jgi:hypothetical protein
LTSKDKLEIRAFKALPSERRIGPHFKPECLRLERPDCRGEVETLAQCGIIDHLHVRPAAAMSDDGIRDYLRKASLQEPAFEDVAIVERHAGSDVRVRDPLRHSPICGQITTASSTRT